MEPFPKETSRLHTTLKYIKYPAQCSPWECSPCQYMMCCILQWSTIQCSEMQLSAMKNSTDAVYIKRCASTHLILQGMYVLENLLIWQNNASMHTTSKCTVIANMLVNLELSIQEGCTFFVFNFYGSFCALDDLEPF